MRPAATPFKLRLARRHSARGVCSYTARRMPSRPSLPRPVPPRAGWLASTALVLAPALFVALSIVRAWRIADGAGNYTGCHDCFWVATFGHDAWLLAIMLAALALACCVRWRVVGFVLRLFAALMLLVFAADM